MRRPDLVDLGIAAAALAAALLVVDSDESPYLITLAFATGMLTLLGMLIRQAMVTGWASLVVGRRVRSLRGIDPAVVASQAVRDERARLSAELDGCIRGALESIRLELTGVNRETDLREPARRIHRRAREATSELRRQLGLLRTSPPQVLDSTSIAPAPHATWRTVLFAAVATMVAAAENWGYYATGEYESAAFVPAWSVPLTALAAATVLGWRVAPVSAAAVLAALFVVPRLTVGVMIGSGGWMVATLGCLAWSLATRGLRDLRALLAAGALAAAAVGSRLYDDPENAEICGVLIAVAWLAGLAVGWNRRRQAAAARRAAALQADLDGARAEAVQGERLTVARELHDVVSHAVGVIAMQAAAAEVSWPAQPEAALRAFETIDRTVTEALGELDRVVPGGTLGGSSHDLVALVERIRATGTQVQLSCSGDPAPAVAPIVYRIVQESLTNAVRHAPGAAVDVLVAAVDDTVHVRVSDDGPGPSDDMRGFGLAGLAERVSLCGGTLHTGRGPDGRGFVVEASLPVRHAEMV